MRELAHDHSTACAPIWSRLYTLYRILLDSTGIENWRTSRQMEHKKTCPEHSPATAYRKDRTHLVEHIVIRFLHMIINGNIQHGNSSTHESGFTDNTVLCIRLENRMQHWDVCPVWDTIVLCL